MGSLESGVPLKRDVQQVPRSSSLISTRIERHASFGQRPRSRFARFVFFKRIDYLQWICAVAVFLLFLVVFQMFLPGSVVDKPGDFDKEIRDVVSGDLAMLEAFGGLDFGERIKFEPSKILEKYRREVNGSVSSREAVRFGYRKPKLAIVFADLSADPYQVMMVTIASALHKIGYDVEVFSLEDGPVRSSWMEAGIPIYILKTNDGLKIDIDWLNYNGILVNSLEAVGAFSSLMQEPFKNVPLIWTIHEQTLATRLRKYSASGQLDLVDIWRRIFRRATVVVFPNYILPVAYSLCDAGNYIVIPGSPAKAWEADNFMALDKGNLRDKMGYRTDDFVIMIVGSQILYRGLWMEHALVLQALLPALSGSTSNLSNSNFKIIVLAGDSAGNYSTAVEAIAEKLGYPNGMVKHIAHIEEADNILSVGDLVIYSSFLEEQSFPEILLKSMCFGKPIIAPDLLMIRKYVDDRVNGYLFPKKNIDALTQVMMQVVSNGKLSLIAHNAASIGKRIAKNLMVSESVEGYALLLENILRFPSEVAKPHPITELPLQLKEEWQWHLFESLVGSVSWNNSRKITKSLDRVEKQRNLTDRGTPMDVTAINETFLYRIWEEEKLVAIANKKKRREDEELKDRTDQPRGTWEEVYRNAKKADRSKNDLHERDDGELERTGQPLCIYEPYFGEGTWPFLHRTSLYRGLGLSTKGRRPGADDIDAPSRLPLLNNPYYRDILGEYGAFFAIGNRIDRVHKNAWIGFQSWRATGRKESLSKTAEASLLDAIEARRHGDTLYFWARMDMDPRNPLKQDFWSFCDSLNSGNCQFAFSEALKKMYGIKQNYSSLPTMPTDGDTWSVMHSWVLPTRSFLEFVMFSRMFVDALDSQFYDEHHQTGYCYLSLMKDKHCYSRMLELLVNVWAYHSARRIIYINPDTGLMQEQHGLKSRRGKMWVKWFQIDTLKSMDGDLAEEADSDKPIRRWLWPNTGEVFWQGIYEKERNLRNREKEKRKQKSKDKLARMRNRAHQKTLGKYIKPPPDEIENSNSTSVTAKLLR